MPLGDASFGILEIFCLDPGLQKPLKPVCLSHAERHGGTSNLDMQEGKNKIMLGRRELFVCVFFFFFLFFRGKERKKGKEKNKKHSPPPH
jgi:hypothetical protein